jgi:hypothetical protein
VAAAALAAAVRRPWRRRPGAVARALELGHTGSGKGKGKSRDQAPRTRDTM